MVANATGISKDNITIVAYDVPFFKYASASGRDVADYLNDHISSPDICTAWICCIQEHVENNRKKQLSRNCL